ncbi:MAG: methyltransferase type 11 [Deltaproteobacteria bacterium]|nr:MAG: methyltransferase type 11 [Deltaproteobacteria bacterium]
MTTMCWDMRDAYFGALEGGLAGDVCLRPSENLEALLLKLPPGVLSQFTGCGSPIPESIEGCRVLDLGCGTGRDVFLCAALTGPKGFVMGLDSEPSMLAVARGSVEEVMKNFGHPEPNVAFREGSFDALTDAGLYKEDFDVVISNRALSMVDDKLKVLKEVHRVLKRGGEFYSSELFSDRRLPEHLKEDPLMKERGLGKTLYLGDFMRMAERAGIKDPRIVDACPAEFDDPALTKTLGEVRFYAVTLRLFKIAELEEGEEDYGQSVLYNGTLEGFTECFKLDWRNIFYKGVERRVDGNTAKILSSPRYSAHFTLIGDDATHLGPFKGPSA